MVNKKQESARNIIRLSSCVLGTAMGVYVFGFIPTYIFGVVVLVIGLIMTKSK